MIDTHTHLYLDSFPEGGENVVSRAVEAGVSHLIMPNVDTTTIGSMMRLHHALPDVTSVAMGLHPTEVRDDWRQHVGEMETMLDAGGFVAVGEVGIDLYWDKTYAHLQKEAFREHLRIADRLDLPVIIHCREALPETLEVIAEGAPKVRLVFHSFTGAPEDVERIREVCDPMFGINGVVTFKNAEPLRTSLQEIGLDRLLLETDSPYLAPVPNRGKRNESAYLPYICRRVADTLGLTSEEVERATDHNAIQTFRL